MPTRIMSVVVLALAFALQPGPSRAAIFSDLWSNPNEQGWGVNIIQQYTVLFVTIFVYGNDGRARWFVASGLTPTGATNNGIPVYSGDLFETTGPGFSAAFGSAPVVARQVGRLTFTPSSYWQGQIVYTVDGASVTKTIQRQTWRHIPLGGRFTGAGVVSSVTGCTGISVGQTETVGLNVTANTSTSQVTVALTENGAPSCTFNGTFTQYGAVYRLNTTSSGCTGTWTFDDYVVEDDGISGNLNGVVGSCRLSLRFAAVRLP